MADYYVNREWVPTDKAGISLNEAGFLRGDGIFESVSLEDGGFFRLGDHLDRLFDGLEKIRIQSQESKEDLAEIIREYVRRNELTDAIIRIIVTRGIYEGNPWEYSGPNSLYITHTFPPGLPEVPARVVYLPEEDYPLIRRHPAVKSLNYLGNMLAKMDAYDAGAFEPVLYNKDGYITEGGIRNIFYVKDEVLLTPPLSLGILPGTMRDAVIEVAEQADINWEERLISIDEVANMDEAFLTSTAVKILPVVWDQWTSEYHVTYRLATTLNLFIEKERTRE